MCHLRKQLVQKSKNLADQELQIIRAASERNSGNISAIARELCINRNMVYKKLKEAINNIRDIGEME